jgi:hypothetical protein
MIKKRPINTYCGHNEEPLTVDVSGTCSPWCFESVNTEHGPHGGGGVEVMIDVVTSVPGKNHW